MPDKPRTKEGLPRAAFAIPGDAGDPTTWKLPHHTGAIRKDRGDPQASVDWDRAGAAVAALSPEGYRGERVHATEEEIIQAARHLSEHYRKAGKDIPATLGALM